MYQEENAKLKSDKDKLFKKIGQLKKKEVIIVSYIVIPLLD